MQNLNYLFVTRACAVPIFLLKTLLIIIRPFLNTVLGEAKGGGEAVVKRYYLIADKILRLPRFIQLLINLIILILVFHWPINLCQVYSIIVGVFR